MIERRSPLTAMVVLIAFVCPSDRAFAFQNEAAHTPVEYVDNPPGPQQSLSTKKYQPSEQEKRFFAKLAPNEIATGGLAGDYNIRTRDKKFVGWFGIVRQISVDEGANTTRLVIEHKYFDGLTDLHLQAVSFNGSGDFEATLKGTQHFVSELKLIKVYGVVSPGDANKLPAIEAQFAKCWSWGSFTFITAAGKQRGSAKWRQLNTVPLDDIYRSRPDELYYVKRLGPTKAIKKRSSQVELGRRAAVAMKVDPATLLDKSGSYTKFISADEFRKRAIESALKLQPESRPHIEPIVAALSNADYDKSRQAIEAAFKAQMHDAVAAVLAHALVLNDDDDTAATHELDDLSYSAGKCVPALVEALRCEDSWSRYQAAAVLGSVGEEAEAAIPALIILLADSDPFCRSNAVEALGGIGRRPELVVPALILAMEDPDLRSAAAGSLGAFDRDARPAARMLARAVANDDDWQAAFSLGQTGDVEVALPVLTKALSSPSAWLRRFAAMGLRELGSEAKTASADLKSLLEDDDSGTRIAAAEALWLIEGNTKDTLPVLEEGLKSGFPIAMWAGDALRQFGLAAKPVLPALLRATKSDHFFVRSSAVRAIASLGDAAQPALPRLKEMLKDEHGETRAGAAAAIWMAAKDKDAIAFLTRELESDGHYKFYVIRAIEMIGKPAQAAVPAIRAHVSDQDQFVRAAARDALQILTRNE
jgi:HEAT repeat protein